MNILVVGDAMLDEYVEVAVDRISPEAPIPVMKEIGRYVVPGGAANCVANIAALGGITILISIKESSTRISTRKTRFVSSGQQIARLDVEDTSPLCEDEECSLLKAIDEGLNQYCNCLVISDYAKGVCSVKICQFAITRAQSLGIPVIIDPKSKNWRRYQGATVITPNEREYDSRREEPDGSFILVTRGNRGMTLFRPTGEHEDVLPLPRGIASVIGAGDTVTAAMAVALAAKLTMREAAEFANAAASIVVGKPGTATVTLDEVANIASPYEYLVSQIRSCV